MWAFAWSRVMRVVAGGAIVAVVAGCSGPTTTLSPQTTPSPGAPAAPADVFVGLNAGGIEEFSPNGAVLSTFATGFVPLDIAMDDAGSVYAVGAQDNTLERFAIGGSAANGAYTNSGGAPFEAVELTPQGVVIAFGEDEFDTTELAAIDVWQPGATGAPTQALDYSAPLDEEFAGLPAVAPDGTLYVAHAIPGARLGVPAGTAYDVLAPGSYKLEREIVDTHGASFRPSCMAAGADGTLYVGEWNASANDPLAGIYVYPPAGPQRAIRDAPAPVAMSLDDAGRLYVLNDNSVSTNTPATPDTVHLFSVYTPGATALLARVSKGFVNGSALTVSPDGSRTYFIGRPAAGASPAVMEIASSASAATVFANVAATNVVLFDGTRATGSTPPL